MVQAREFSVRTFEMSALFFLLFPLVFMCVQLSQDAVSKNLGECPLP